MAPIWPRRTPKDTDARESLSSNHTVDDSENDVSDASPKGQPDVALAAHQLPADGLASSGKRVEVRGKGAVGAGGNVEKNAIGPYSSVTIVEASPVPAPSWPMRLGVVPALASGFQPRETLRSRIDQARAEGGAVVLTQVMSGGGGVGKTQLAASYAREAQLDGTELVLWVAAGDSEQVVAQYAQAARRVQAPGADGLDAESDARSLMGWLATTERSWLVVLDDVTDFEAISRWWPPDALCSKGRVLATTRLRDAAVSGRLSTCLCKYGYGSVLAGLSAVVTFGDLAGVRGAGGQGRRA